MIGENIKRVGYRFPEVAKMLGMCDRTIKRWIESGELPKPVRLGKELFILAEDWEAYLERQKAKA